MRRPIRTRRLSIAAILSFAAFVFITFVGIRSLWIVDGWSYATGQAITLAGGRATYTRLSVSGLMPTGRVSSNYPARSTIGDAIWGFSVEKEILADSSSANPAAPVKAIAVTAPIWPILLLLLIAPVCWLIARPANAPAFPIITEAKQPDPRDAIPLMRDQKPKRD